MNNTTVDEIDKWMKSRDGEILTRFNPEDRQSIISVLYRATGLGASTLLASKDVMQSSSEMINGVNPIYRDLSISAYPRLSHIDSTTGQQRPQSSHPQGDANMEGFNPVFARSPDSYTEKDVSNTVTSEDALSRHSFQHGKKYNLDSPNPMGESDHESSLKSEFM